MCSAMASGTNSSVPSRDGLRKLPPARSSPAPAATSSRLFQPWANKPATAQALADAVFKSAMGEFEIRGQQISIGLSLGAAIFPRDGTDAASLMVNADAALYRAKADGRRIMHFSTPKWTGG